MLVNEGVCLHDGIIESCFSRTMLSFGATAIIPIYMAVNKSNHWPKACHIRSDRWRCFHYNSWRDSRFRLTSSPLPTIDIYCICLCYPQQQQLIEHESRLFIGPET